MAGFQTEKFLAAKFEPRIEVVPVPALEEFFDEGAAPEFTLRSLTSSELQKANDSNVRNSALEAVAKAVSGHKEQIDMIRKALGLTSDTPGEVARRVDILVFGCVSPVLSHAVVAKLAETFPIEFFDLTNRIVKLSGQGGSRVKPVPSS